MLTKLPYLKKKKFGVETLEVRVFLGMKKKKKKTLIGTLLTSNHVMDDIMYS